MPDAKLNAKSDASALLYRLDRDALIRDAKRAIPEAFGADGRVLAPIAGNWKRPGTWFTPVSPIDGRGIIELPILAAAEASAAVEDARGEFPAWSALSLDLRVQVLTQASAALKENRDLLARVLAWEIGKTMPTAYNDIDRCIAGLDWFLGKIGHFLDARTPLGLVSNVASWNYPFSVLLLNVLVQALSGNSVVAKIPTQGGGFSLTLAFGILRRVKLPVTLIGGRGRDLTEPLVGHRDIAAVAFVGGRTNGGTIATSLRATGKRYALEMEGVNPYVLTGYSDWSGLAKQIRTGFDFGKQRCTAYARWVIERPLVPKFIETYTDVVSKLRVGNPLMGVEVDFGPLISAAKVKELDERIAEARRHGSEIRYEGRLAEDAFLPGQDRGAYFAPRLVYGLRAPSTLYGREAFGPVDVIIPVDSEDEMIREANVSNGALVGSVGCDDVARGERLTARLNVYKSGVNKLRSRGDKEETFGGTGGSWEGAFVGGAYLVDAFTDGERRAAGNFPKT